jgi:hypothetical protein
MFVCFDELLIKEDVPLRVHQLAAAMLDDSADVYTFAAMFGNEVLKCIWKLPYD